MKYVRRLKNLRGRTLIATVAVLSLLGLSTIAFAQQVVDKPIRGTIEVAEQADLQALAQITLEQARAAAQAAVPGAAFVEGELEEEDGYLVYEIELTENGREVEVLVDAGNAAVLEREYDDEEDDD